MKKIVSLLLTFSMVLGLAACGSKAEETKKKKKKTKKTTTEITETTEVPTVMTSDEPTETEETTTTEAPTETTAPVSSDLVISHDLDAVFMTADKYSRLYGALDPNDDTGSDVGYYPFLNYVHVDAEVVNVNIEHDEPQNVQNTLQNIDDDTFYALNDYSQLFLTEADAFYKKEQNGEELTDYYYRNSINIYRADAQIISYVSESYEYREGYDFGDEVCTPHNYRVEDGTAIRLTDIVTDIPALVTYVQETFEDAYVLDDILKEIKNGTVPFGILYDGIFLVGVNGKIPVIGHESMFDMSYFGATPEYYTMYLDKYYDLTWDFDGDGQLEDLFVQQAGTDHLYIHFKGNDFDFFRDDIPELTDDLYISDYENQYVVFSDSGCYLLLSMNGDDDYTELLIFEIKDGKVEYKSAESVWIEDAHDPTNINVGAWASVLGFTGSRMRVSINDGHLQAYTVLGTVYTGAYKLNVDLKGKEFDNLTMDIGKDITIPKGTPVTVVYYEGISGQMVLRVLNPNDLLQYDVLVETDGDSKIAGKDVDDVLIGVHWGG